MKRTFRAAVLGLLMPAMALAVAPVTTTHTTEADFTASE